mmetsp:Transcript_153463/g.491885  ORF Transcript_153463/g.491885 Transcript_153463/m.491885 type:complete len:430 (-) Transcript_153463:178-1467(-)
MVEPHDELVVQARRLQPVHLEAICVVAGRAPHRRHRDAQALVLQLNRTDGVKELHQGPPVLWRRPLENVGQRGLELLRELLHKVEGEDGPREVDQRAQALDRPSLLVGDILPHQRPRELDLVPPVRHGQGIEQLRDLRAHQAMQFRCQGVREIVDVALCEEPQLRKRVGHLGELSWRELSQVLKRERAESPEEEASSEPEPGDDREGVDDVPGGEAVDLVGHALDDEVHQLAIEDAPAAEGLEKHDAMRGLEVVNQLEGLGFNELDSCHIPDTTNRKGDGHVRQVPRVESILSPHHDLGQSLCQLHKFGRRGAKSRRRVCDHRKHPCIAIVQPTGERSQDGVEAAVLNDLLIVLKVREPTESSQSSLVGARVTVRVLCHELQHTQWVLHRLHRDGVVGTLQVVTPQQQLTSNQAAGPRHCRPPGRRRGS